MMTFLGFNLIPENLETGEFIENASTSIKGTGICYVIAFSRSPSEIGGPTSSYNGCLVNGIASGLWYYIGNMNKVLEMLETIDKDGFGGDVKAVFSIPTIAILGWSDEYTLEELDDQFQVWGFWVNNQFYGNGREFSLSSTPSQLDNYTPRNQKLRTYPYCYLGFTPSNGTPKIFRYENFKNGTPNFKMISEINPNPSLYFIPKDYKGEDGLNVSESAIIQGYPNISYKSDFFSNWLAQNSNIVNLQMEQSKFNYEIGVGKTALNYTGQTIDTLFSLFTAKSGSKGTNARVGAIGNFVSESGNVLLDSYSNAQNMEYSIKEVMLNAERQSMLPNTGSLGSTNTTLLGYNLFNNDIFTRFSIKSQFARRIDKYFDMYGYQTNELKLPNINNRPNWNYVKTLGLNILNKGSVPQEDMEEIKNIFNNGVTLWHNTKTFLDYSQNNR